MGFEQLAEPKKQLAAKAKTERPAKPKAKPRAAAPRKIGIHQELRAKAKEIGLEEAAITDAVNTWCRVTRYWASIVDGAPRVDLKGNQAGEVTARDAAQARSMEARRKQPRKPKPEAAPAATPPEENHAEPAA